MASPPPPPVEPHCPLSRCETEPGYCAESVSIGEFVALSFIIFVPILVALLAPIFASRLSKVQAMCCMGDDDRNEAAPSHRSVIDPPMFLCGVGLLPLECGLSGLLTVIFVMCSAVVVIFFSLLLSSNPCASGLGECRTISCICGNVLPEGYVFMFCSLMLTSLILVQRISRMFHHMRRQHKVLKAVLVLGALLLTLTGIFPERYDRNQMAYATLYTLHLCGVCGSGLLLLGVPFAWFAEHWATHRRAVPLSSLVVRLVYVMTVLSNGGALYYYSNLVVDETNNYCAAISTEAECSAWPTMAPASCAASLACVSNSSAGAPPDGAPALCDSFVQPNFQCEWRPTELNNWTRLIAPAQFIQAVTCMRARCPLYSYARGVALEFAVLLLTLGYVSTFGLHDVRRLLDRPPSSDGGDAAPIVVALDASRLMAQTDATAARSADAAAREKRLVEDMHAAGDDAPLPAPSASYPNPNPSQGSAAASGNASLLRRSM